MPKPRYTQVSLQATPYYHCVSRCVRRAYLCGLDIPTGKSYEHRRQWVEDKLLFLGSVFAIDICSYAIMSNHYHVVLHVNQTQAEAWSMQEVITTWHQLFAGTALSQRYIKGDAMSKAEMKALDPIVVEWRERLMDISWFMRILNEGIARQANTEEHCTGRFWEGRFKSQALLDEAALLTCMAYADLNPIRAQMANTPETSDHTSIKHRIEQALKHTKPKQLFPFVGNPRKHMPAGIPFQLNDYIDLVEWTGRIIRDDKRGHIKSSTPALLHRLNIDKKSWLYLTQHFESQFKGLVGSTHKLKQACQQLGYQRTPCLRSCEAYFPG